jgi:hypothetical protein
MAILKGLAKTIPGFTGELTATDVYFKVIYTFGNKDRITATVEGTVDGRQVYLSDHGFDHNVNGPNVVKQAYEHLKTLPEFANAIDC